MRIFVLLLALFALAVSDANAQRRAPVRRAPVRAFRAPVRAFRAPIRRFVAPIRRFVAPIVVNRVSAFRTEQVVVRRVVAAQRIGIPTYQAYVAPQTIVSQEVATDPCPIQHVTVAREVSGYSGGCGTQAIRIR